MSEIERGPGRPHRGAYKDADGKKVPSTTSILDQYDAKPGLNVWRMRHAFEEGLEMGALMKAPLTKKAIEEARRKVERDGFRPELIGKESGYTGSAVHDAVESDIHGDDPIATLDAFGLNTEQRKHAQRALGAWRQWREANPQIRFLATEIPLVSDDLGFGGTIDALAEENGKPLLVDFKTSKRFYAGHIYQLGGYVQLLRDAREIEVADALVLRLCKSSGKPKVWRIGGVQLDCARKGFLLRLRAMRLDESFRRFYSAQLNPPRRRKAAS